MSEPDSTSRRRPPTIDLTAKEVEGEPAGSAQDAAAAGAATDRVAAGNAAGESGGRTSRSRAGPYAVGIVLGAIASAAIVAGMWVAGFVPPHEPTVAQSAQPATPAATDEISSRLERIQQALQAPRSDETLTARIAAAEAQAKSLGDALAALTRRVDDIAASSQSALAQGKAAAAAADDAKNAAQASVQPGAVDALAQRVAALESAVKSLTAEVAQNRASANDAAVRATVAAEALRAAIERGAPYQAELAAVKSFGADAGAAAALEPFAADGVPTAATLGRELAALVPALQRASEPEPNGGSLLDRLEAHAQRLVRITPIDAAAAPSPPAGDNPASLIARINSDAAHGDIAAALADIARLPDDARTLGASWVKKAQAREAAIAASRRIAADALAALAKPAAQ
jgi:hypothetical protein